MRNCFLLQRLLLEGTEQSAKFVKLESEIKIQACQVLNKILDLR